MTDVSKIAAAYIAAWNETDAARRAVRLAETFVTDASYIDPIMAGANREEIGGLIAGVQQRFTLRGQPDGYGAKLRFSWTLGPAGIEPPIEGTDFVSLADGKIEAVTGFLDKVPAAA